MEQTTPFPYGFDIADLADDVTRCHCGKIAIAAANGGLCGTHYAEWNVVKWVKTPEGRILLEANNSYAKHGFFLYDEDQSWDGGVGIATTWEVIPLEEVPDLDRERLMPIYEEL